eukprot:TRINITY_DN19881_c0_g1_i1.p1 TRINITY_DN19881_c0_g1~~TRINITY_DN19881_c0_g1_i1.p1  ORF type:complete len:405 (+),score=60.15 TRINITY_DN19881_c0_g1_i1:32-1246(+)
MCHCFGLRKWGDRFNKKRSHKKMEHILKILAPPMARQRHGLPPAMMMELVGSMVGKFADVDIEKIAAGTIRDDSTTKGTLLISAMMHGTWSKEYRKTSHMLYMAHCKHMYSDWEQSLPANLKDHTYLPSHKELRVLLDHPQENGWPINPQQYDKTLQRANLCSDKIEALYNMDKLLDPEYISVEELFLMLDPFDTKTFTKLHFFCEQNGFCNVLNQEMISELANHLKSQDRPIIEVGAGSGRLTHFLKQYGVNDIRATDHKPDGYISGYSTGNFPVERADSDEVVKKYCPHTILCSWMPEGIDWTSSWRTDQINKYILLGEPFGGQSGTPWDTFGVVPQNEFALPPWLGGATFKEPPTSPPYIQDGYTQHLSHDVGKWMIGQRDTGIPTTGCLEYRIDSHTSKS